MRARRIIYMICYKVIIQVDLEYIALDIFDEMHPTTQSDIRAMKV